MSEAKRVCGGLIRRLLVVDHRDCPRGDQARPSGMTDGEWLTYIEVGKRLGVSVEAVRAMGLSQTSGIDGSSGMAVDFTLRFGGT
jgi:hypothetical protein